MHFKIVAYILSAYFHALWMQTPESKSEMYANWYALINIGNKISGSRKPNFMKKHVMNTKVLLNLKKK